VLLARICENRMQEGRSPGISPQLDDGTRPAVVQIAGACRAIDPFPGNRGW
jgi:hypothetical protein